MVAISGFSSAPTSRFIILSSLTLSIFSSILDLKHLLPIKPTPHLWPYFQLSRLLTFQLAYLSSTEILFSTLLLYHFRILERLWGSRKYASFVFVVSTLNVAIVPSMCLLLKALTLGSYNYIPSGLTSMVFACLALWSSEVPRLYRYKIITGSGTSQGSSPPGITLSDKSTTYVLAAQLALSQFPYNLVPAAVGWIMGSAWEGEMLPMGLTRWRVPAWVVGESRQKRGQFEGLRRRLEEEGGSTDGMRNVSDQTGSTSEGRETGARGWGRQVAGYFTGS